MYDEHIHYSALVYMDINLLLSKERISLYMLDIISVYLIGLIIGLVFYALTYLFSRNIENIKRATSVFIAGVISYFIIIFAIGGFESILFLFLSLGIVTIAILFKFFGKSPLSKKIIYTTIGLVAAIYVALGIFYKVDYTVIPKRALDNGDQVDDYIKAVQDHPKVRGFNTFTIEEGDKLVILSLGEDMEGNSIEVLDVNERNGRTEIEVKSYYDQSTEKNPWIGIALNRIQDEMIITDTDGTVYKKVTNID